MIDKRLMYAQGRRVGFQGGGRDASQDDFGSEDVSGKGDNDRPNMADIAGPVSTSTNTTTDKDSDFDPFDHTRFDVGSGYYGEPVTSGSSNLGGGIITFAPTPPPKKNLWDGVKQVLGIASFFSPSTVVGKIGKVVSTIDNASKVSALANKFGITNTDVLGSLTNNLSDNFTGFNNTTSKGPKGPPDDRGNGNGDNQQNALLSEYLLLLKRMEQGMLSAEEQGRFNSLKSRLGKADGGIMDVNMNKGRLGETLYG